MGSDSITQVPSSGFYYIDGNFAGRERNIGQSCAVEGGKRGGCAVKGVGGGPAAGALEADTDGRRSTHVVDEQHLAAVGAQEEVVVQVAGGTPVCREVCDPVTQAPCGTGLSCTYNVATRLGACGTAGTKGEGATCTTST